MSGEIDYNATLISTVEKDVLRVGRNILTARDIHQVAFDWCVGDRECGCVVEGGMDKRPGVQGAGRSSIGQRRRDSLFF